MQKKRVGVSLLEARYTVTTRSQQEQPKSPKTRKEIVLPGKQLTDENKRNTRRHCGNTYLLTMQRQRQ